jgi:hypothetical protein
MRGRDDGKKPVRFNSMTDGVSFVPCFLAENFSHYLLSCMRLKMRKTFVILKNGVMEIHDNNCLLEEFFG